MSVLCCHIPDFLYRCQEASLSTQPVVLLGPDETVWALSPTARQAGLGRGLRPRQVQARCPEALIQPLALAAGHQTQQAFLQTLGALGLPVEAFDWGAAYVDLHTVASEKRDV